MRIGIEVSKAAGPVDGIGRFTTELLRALFTVIDGEELWLYSLLRPLAEETLRQRLGDWPEAVRFRGSAPAAADALDLFHATAWTVPPAFRRPVVFTCHDLTFLTLPECHTLENKLHCATGVLRAVLADATFHAVSHATAGELERQLAVPSARVEVIYPAPASHCQPQPTAEARARVEAAFGVTQPYVLAVGTLEPRKNLRRLLAAYGGLPPALRNRHPLLVAGAQGWGHDELAQLVRDRPELTKVRLLGPVADDDLAALYNAAELFAYPSLAEGFGLPVAEAMACGAPVLTADVPALAEVAGGAARLVDPRDEDALGRALGELLADEGARDDLRRRGRERAAAFSWPASARALLALYCRLARA